jgi:hypothetical protein
MLRTYRIAAAACVATFALSTTGFAATARPKARAVVGTLQKVEGRTIIVQTSKGAETVQLVSGSWIHRGAETIQPASLPSYAGQRVKVRYVDLDGEKQAQTVTVASARISKK